MGQEVSHMIGEQMLCSVHRYIVGEALCFMLSLFQDIYMQLHDVTLYVIIMHCCMVVLLYRRTYHGKDIVYFIMTGRTYVCVK